MNKAFTSNNMTLVIKTKTWSKDTQDLFDFETSDLVKSELQANNSSYLCLINGNFHVINNLRDFSTISPNNKIIIDLSYLDEGVMLYNPHKSKRCIHLMKHYLDRLWYVFPKNEAQELKQDDMIKLGRVRLKLDKVCLKSNKYYETNIITQTVVGEGKEGNLNLSQTNLNYKSNNKSFLGDESINPVIPQNTYLLERSLDNKHAKSCRICFLGKSSDSDPLLSPCRCSGSMSYIHYYCLKQCLNMKLIKKSSEWCTYYFLKSYECEICLTEYPKFIRHKNVIYTLLEINPPYNEYAILDYILFDEDKQKFMRKGFVVLKLQEGEELSIGRTHSNHLKFNDISVSRLHCTLLYKNDKLFLFDKKSKFGTLKYIYQSLKFDSNMKDIQIQSSKSVFEVSYSKPFSFFGFFKSPSLCCSYKPIENDLIINFDEIEEGENNSKIYEREIKDNLCDSFNDLIINLDNGNILTEV